MKNEKEESTGSKCPLCQLKFVGDVNEEKKEGGVKYHLLCWKYNEFNNLNLSSDVIPILFDEMNLYIGHREYILEATGKSEKLTEKNFSHKHRIISISFDTQNITPIASIPLETVDQASKTRYFGCLGILTLYSKGYLILVKKRILIGKIQGWLIFRLVKVKILPIEDSITPEKFVVLNRSSEETYLKAVKQLLNSGDFYYSYTYDITNSLQRKEGHNPNTPLFLRVDRRFFWNWHLQRTFIENNCYSWILPIMRGFIQIISFLLEDRRLLEIALISRRSRFRAGTRYLTRGVDQQGNVANYVETEQITSFASKIASFVQTRGSIPLFWEQKGFKYNPTPQLSQTNQTNPAFLSHFDEQLVYYNQQLVLDLLNQKGSEQKLSEAFKTLLDSTPFNIKYECFDFHFHCKNMKFEKVSILLDNLSNQLESFGYFFKDERGKEMKQRGTIRTNCLDCLDRTNIVQSAIAKMIFKQQLKIYGILDILENNKLLEKLFNKIWANNGDAMSRQYAGTQALKGDFTRTGKRNVSGLVNDGVNSLSRYYINNFRDKLRQRAIDILLGKDEQPASWLECNDWTEKQIEIMNTCIFRIFEHLKNDKFEFIGVWMILRINQRGKEQERVLILTKQSLFRCKFNSNKVIHFKEYPLDKLRSIEKGYLDANKTKYGIHFIFKDSKITSQHYTSSHGKDFMEEIVNRVCEFMEFNNFEETMAVEVEEPLLQKKGSKK